LFSFLAVFVSLLVWLLPICCQIKENKDGAFPN
jgi:hypothetical protein